MGREKGVSIFACDAQDVYSDVEVSLGGGVSTIKVEDTDKDFHFAKRKATGAWINTGMFMQVWKAIGKKGAYSSYDWTVKVDPDAVFFPSKLRARIHLLPIPPGGGFLQNCEGVDYGFFGNLEVFTKTAFSTLVANIDTCKTGSVSNWKEGVKHGKHGPMGEDLFAEICLRKNGAATKRRTKNGKRIAQLLQPQRSTRSKNLRSISRVWMRQPMWFDCNFDGHGDSAFAAHRSTRSTNPWITSLV